MSIRWFELDDEERRRVAERLKAELLGEEAVALAFLFGSFLEGGPFRDVDVAVYLARDLDMLEARVYADDLASRLSRAIGLPVDVVVLNYAPGWLRRRALRGVELVVRDEFLFAALWANVLDEELGLALHSR